MIVVRLVPVDVSFALSASRTDTSPFALFGGNGIPTRFEGRLDSFQRARTFVIARLVFVVFMAFVVFVAFVAFVAIFIVLDGNRHSPFSPLMMCGICSGSNGRYRIDLFLRDAVQTSAVRRGFRM